MTVAQTSGLAQASSIVSSDSKGSEATAHLYRYDDVCDDAADAVRCIDARLQSRGLQLDPHAGVGLRRILEGVLGMAEVESLDVEFLVANVDNEGSPADPNEPHRTEVGWPDVVEAVVEAAEAACSIASIAEMVARNHPEKPELIAEVQALAAQYEQALILRGVGQ